MQAGGVDPSRPQARRAGMKQVAERAGVAISSVSRVISDHPDVSDEMRARVLAAIDELGFQPDVLAQSLRTGESRTIGFVVADIGNPLFAEIALGAETVLREAGYSMIVANALNDPALTVQSIRSMIARRVDGVLVSVNDESDDLLKETIAAAPFPVALIDRELEGVHVASVLSDHTMGTRAAMEHLVALGHRRVALVNGPQTVRPSRERATTLEAVALTHGAVADIRWGAFSAEHGQATTLELMRGPGAPTAIIAGSNQILVGVLRGLRLLGLRIPDDVSLVTCDDVTLSEFLTPALSTIWRDPELMGSMAANQLLQQLAGTRTAAQIHLPTGFRITDSCDVPRVAREA
jgi:LacI family transcriptional regulator